MHDKEVDLTLNGSATEDTDDSDEPTVVLELSLEKETPLDESGKPGLAEES